MARRTPTRVTRDAAGRGVLSRRVIALSYTHAEDGQHYEHEFARGVTIECLPDRSIRLYRPDGEPLWKDFL